MMVPGTLTRSPRTPAKSHRPLRTALVFLAAITAVAPARAQTTYGTLSNFDVFNTTGQDCHGFEIELDGISVTDVSFTFGSPYQRYGNPTIVGFSGGVYVRYESSYVGGAFTATTPQAPTPITPTGGHACWYGGDPSYPTAGCEHFGIGVVGNPTNTVYRWLIADPNVPGALQPSGTKVSIPAPTWNVAPPAQPGMPPVVQAVLPAPPPEVEAQFGEAQWVKVFVTESPDPVELHHLVTDDPAVPQEPGETETEWVILQSDPSGGGNSELVGESQAKADSQSVTRRYEFYKYTGAYDPESHEALCGGDGTCSAPLEGELGDYLGAQMAAVNLVAIVPSDTPTPTAPVATTPTETATEGLPTATPSITDTPIAPTATPTGNASASPSASRTPTAPSLTPTSTAPAPSPTPTGTAPKPTPTATASTGATRTPSAVSSPGSPTPTPREDDGSCAISPTSKGATGGRLLLAGLALMCVRRHRRRRSR